MKEGTHTFLHKNMERNEKKERAKEREEDVETGVRCKDSQFACTSTPFLSLCTIWIREKSLNPGWLWTTKRSLNYTPNLQLYARTHSHQAHRGCDMRNQILKKGGNECVIWVCRMFIIFFAFRTRDCIWWWRKESHGSAIFSHFGSDGSSPPVGLSDTVLALLHTAFQGSTHIHTQDLTLEFRGYLAQFNNVTRLRNSHRVDRKEWQLL